MNKPITTFASLKRLFDDFEPQFATEVIAVIWRVIAVVQCFFQKGNHSRQHRSIRKTTRTPRTRIGSCDHAANIQTNRIP